MPAHSKRTKRARGIALTIAFICAAIAASACTSAQASPSPNPNGAPPTTSSSTGTAATATLIADCCEAPTKLPYALVTARPNKGAGPAPSTWPRATPTAADSLSQEGTGYFSEALPAGGSTTLLIDFEGSSWGAVVVYAKSDGLTVSLKGQALPKQKAAMLGDNGWAYSMSSENAANGDLVIRNTAGSPVELFGYVTIMTRRHLSIETSSLFPHKGQQVTFDLSLTQATDTDDVTVSSVGSDGKATTVSMTKVGTGHWTGRATFSQVGEYVIRASTTGARTRVVSRDVNVTAGEVTVSPSFKEDVEDSDHDGFIDELVLTPTITVPVAGKYEANATLVDESGAQVTMDLDGQIDLVSGAQPLILRFGGKYIYESGRWGPYTLHVTVMHDLPSTTTIELDDTVLGRTAAYDYMQFQHDRIALDPKSLKSTAVDTNGDGLFDELDLTGSVAVESAGLFEINAGLYADNPWGEVASAYAKSQLAAGPNSFRLVYKGSDIAKSGQDGPYKVPSLVIYFAADPMGDSPSGDVNYTTAAYKASQFGP
jgi:hypothetical protein